MTGRLIVLEGLDCAGKSTLLPLVAKRLRDLGHRVTITGEMRSPLGESIRRLLHKSASPLTKTLAFAADRAWLWRYVAAPALCQGRLVLWDRYVASALAYRGAEIELNTDAGITLEYVRAVNAPFPRPDVSVFVDIPVQLSIERAKAKRSHEPDSRVLREVQRQYSRLRKRGRWIRIDGTRPPDAVATILTDSLEAFLGGRKP